MVNKKQVLNRFDLLIELLNFVLNNREKFNVKVDKGGWIVTTELIKKCQELGYLIDKTDIDGIILKNKNSKNLQFINSAFVKSLKKTEASADLFKDMIKKN